MRSIGTVERRTASTFGLACASIGPALFIAVVWLASASMAQAQTGAIAGAVRLVDCGARESDVTVSAGTRTVSVNRDPSNELVLRYRITGLAKGQHTVTPRLAAGKCPGGAWGPPSRNVRLNAGQSVTGQDFEYRVPRQTKRLEGAQLAALIEAAFRGTQVQLNNYGPRHGDSWHKANDSLIRLGPGVGGGELRFDIAEIRGAAGRRYYVDHLSLTRLSVRPETGAVKLLLEFEKRGAEIKGRCAGEASCFGASDDPAPDFSVNNARLELYLTPTRDPSGGIGYGPVRAAFSVVVDGAGMGELADGLVERQIKAAVEASARQALDQRTVQDHVVAALRPALDKMQIAAVAGVQMDGQDLLVEYLAQ
jgi:hypothetical protein